MLLLFVVYYVVPNGKVNAVQVFFTSVATALFIGLIIGPRFINAFGKTKFDQSAIEKIARIIAGEGSTGAVGAF